MERTGVIIVAGGSGQRCGGGLPKQFRLLGGKPVLARTINRFAEALPGARIVVVLPAEYAAFWKNLAARFEVAPHTVAEGGPERFHSVRNGIAALAGDEELIAVQDAVRPLGSTEMIRRVSAAAARYGAAIPVTQPVDSFRLILPPEAVAPECSGNPETITAQCGTTAEGPTGAADECGATAEGRNGAAGGCGTTVEGDGISPAGDAAPGMRSAAIDRRRLRIVQTPQIFRADLLRKAYEAAFDPCFTDDASVVERAGHPVHLAEGERTNLKITAPEDFTLAEAILAACEQTDEEDADDL